jgi:hypothetical protein
VSAQLAYVDGAGRIRCRDPLTGDERVLAGPWMCEDPDEEDLVFRWPTWSPGGDRLAVEGLELGEEGAERAVLWMLTADGVRAEALEELSDDLVYLQWGAKGDRILLLTGGPDEDLTLKWTADGDTPLVDGAPLFFCSTGEGGVAAHVFAEDPERARLVFFPGGGRPPEAITTRPGRFRSPCLLADGRILFTAGIGGAQRLASWSPALGLEEASTALGDVRVALLTDARGRALVASGGPDASEFEALDLWAPGSQPERLCQTPFSAALPLPAGGVALLVAQESGAFAWHVMGEPGRAEGRELMRFVPTEEEALRLGFFDQYQRSHAALSPDGSALTVAGVDVGARRIPGEPQVYLLSLDSSGPAEPIGPGRFAVWSPEAGRG